MKKTSCVGSRLAGLLASAVLVATACLPDIPHAPDYLAEDAHCGNGIIDPGEECDELAVEATCLELGYVNGVPSCDSHCTYDVSTCGSHPEAGQVIITEIMKQPVSDEEGIEAEWFEIFNLTNQALELSGCTVEGPGEPGFLVDPAGYGLRLGPMEHGIFSSDAGDPPPSIGRWSFHEFALSNDAPDAIRLACGGVVVDEVSYDDTTFPDLIGRSITLDPGAYTAVANDDGARWCACTGTSDDQHRYGHGDWYAFGTPTAANPGCPTASASGAVLFFSEYVDGTALDDDALEIHNASEAPVGLGACEVQIYYDGVIEPDSVIPLDGSLPGGSVTVLCNAGFAELESCDLLSSEVVFGGSETIVLACDGSTIDVFGRIGYDPGIEWSVGGIGTRRVTLRRRCETTMGDAVGTDPFDPAIEWFEAPVNDFSDLERYDCFW